MSYTKNTWATGDTITAAKLNNMEDGIEAAADDYPGYDVVIHLVNGIEMSAATPTLVKGLWSTILPLIIAKKPISIFVYRTIQYDSGDYDVEYDGVFVTKVYADGSYHENLEITVTDTLTQISSATLIINENGISWRS